MLVIFTNRRTIEVPDLRRPVVLRIHLRHVEFGDPSDPGHIGHGLHQAVGQAIVVERLQGR